MIFRSIVPPIVAAAIGVAAVTFLFSANANESSRFKDRPAIKNDANSTLDRDNGFSVYVDSDGVISLPTDYKQHWAHLGSWAVAKRTRSDIFEIHDVYTARETITSYNTTGEFPDGSVLVKEVRNSKSERLTSGNSSWSTDIKIWFVMIKDRQNRFEDNEHWGDGWGWALFEAKNPTKNVSVGYTASCIDCHRPAKENDWIYIQAYPELMKPEIKKQQARSAK